MKSMCSVGGCGPVTDAVRGLSVDAADVVVLNGAPDHAWEFDAVTKIQPVGRVAR